MTTRSSRHAFIATALPACPPSCTQCCLLCSVRAFKLCPSSSEFVLSSALSSLFLSRLCHRPAHSALPAQWGGLIKDYQAVRMQMFVAQAVADATAGHATVDAAKFTADFRARQQVWVHKPWDNDVLPAEPVGDTVAISRKLQALVQ